MSILTAMVGGGPGSMIGEAHRAAAKANSFVLHAGVFSRDLAKSRAQAKASGVSETRAFDHMPAMLAACPELEAVIVCAPNAAHYHAARTALDAGLHVIVDKPMTVRTREAEDLVARAAAKGLLLGVTYSWGAYPAFSRMRAMVREGTLGEVRLIDASFMQDWLTTRLEDTGAMAALSRTDPALVGISGATGDVGTHLWRMAETVMDETPAALSADLTNFVVGRAVDDSGFVRARYDSGARLLLTMTQAVASGGGKGSFRVHGSKAMAEWSSADPLSVTLTPLGGRPERFACPLSGPFPDLPGAPPGFLNAFSALYSEFAAAILSGTPPANDGAAGLSGVRFVEAAVVSSQMGGAWVDIPAG